MWAQQQTSSEKLGRCSKNLNPYIYALFIQKIFRCKVLPPGRLWVFRPLEGGRLVGRSFLVRSCHSNQISQQSQVLRSLEVSRSRYENLKVWPTNWLIDTRGYVLEMLAHQIIKRIVWYFVLIVSHRCSRGILRAGQAVTVISDCFPSQCPLSKFFANLQISIQRWTNINKTKHIFDLCPNTDTFVWFFLSTKYEKYLAKWPKTNTIKPKGQEDPHKMY